MILMLEIYAFHQAPAIFLYFNTAHAPNSHKRSRVFTCREKGNVTVEHGLWTAH